ncbi:helix-turn-helix domain-containing protein [Methanolacinia paynteri]|uniref:helix-turn-helix domain-containing protein n=1 Tax=Methanolacinia paynteri TaxID=230356 RepID=UPI00064FF018|nr:helix-turn-helix domain-containing protein [Methanolacinia paynteri]
MGEIEKMYPLEEAAEYLGTKPRELRKYINEGRLPAIKIGQTWRIKESTIKKIQSGELVI